MDRLRKNYRRPGRQTLPVRYRYVLDSALARPSFQRSGEVGEYLKSQKLKPLNNSATSPDHFFLPGEGKQKTIVKTRTYWSGKLCFLLPCQWEYWHRAKNRLRDKTGFEMYNPQNVEKSGFRRSVCVCLSGRLSVLLSLFPRALTGVRFNRSS